MPVFHITQESEGIYEARVKPGVNSIPFDVTQVQLKGILSNTPKEINNLLGLIYDELKEKGDITLQ